MEFKIGDRVRIREWAWPECIKGKLAVVVEPWEGCDAGVAVMLETPLSEPIWAEARRPRWSPDDWRKYSHVHVTSGELELVEAFGQRDAICPPSPREKAIKPSPSLIPSRALQEVLRAFQAGLDKGYEPLSWRTMDNAEALYAESLLRHTEAVREAVQEYSTLPAALMAKDPDQLDVYQLAAVAANALILLDLALKHFDRDEEECLRDDIPF